MTGKGSPASSTSVVLCCAGTAVVGGDSGQNYSCLNLLIWMDASRLISGGNFLFLWFQNKSRCLDREPLSVMAGGGEKIHLGGAPHFLVS